MEPIAIFLSSALAPIMLGLMLLLARPFLLGARKLPDSRLKRFLLFRYNEAASWKALFRRAK